MPKPPNRSELIAVKVLREQAWAYARRLEHLSYNDMRSLANRSVDEGGLGYDLSTSALKALVTGYVAEQREVLTADRDELIARELADLDLVQRELAADVVLANKRIKRAAEIEALDVHALKVKHSALDRYRVAGQERRKLVGLDAPTEARLEVTVTKDLADELNVMLARAGAPPIESVILE